jgi:L,D-transpeptidase catalytic domain
MPLGAKLSNTDHHSLGAFALGLALASTVAFTCTPAAAKVRYKPTSKDTEHVSTEPFGNIPKGPIQIFVSINQQKLHVYSDGAHVADTSVATGVPSLPTPLGVFSVIQKQVFHRSNIYSNAPMPFMQRITWSGVALHEGESIGHRASHGCIRMPREFAMRLYKLTKIGARVIVANGELKPSEFADPHLFVHKDKAPPPTAAAPAPAPAVQTAQSIDAGKAIDAAPADATLAAQPAALGLRVTGDFSADNAKSDPTAKDAPKPDVSKPDAQKDVTPVVAVGISAPASIQAADAAAPSATPDNAGAVVPAKPAEVAQEPPAKRTPIAIFISRKEKKIYVRQDFEPIFNAAITIDQPEKPLGTHVFTAMNYLDDHSTFRWTVVSLPGETPKPSRNVDNERRYDRYGRVIKRRGEGEARAVGDPQPSQTPAEALARIEIPQDAIDYISQMMVPGSSLIVSDQGLGGETGEGTDFIVVTR